MSFKCQRGDKKVVEVLDDRQRLWEFIRSPRKLQNYVRGVDSNKILHSGEDWIILNDKQYEKRGCDWHSIINSVDRIEDYTSISGEGHTQPNQWTVEAANDYNDKTKNLSADEAYALLSSAKTTSIENNYVYPREWIVETDDNDQKKLNAYEACALLLSIGADYTQFYRNEDRLINGWEIHSNIEEEGRRTRSNNSQVVDTANDHFGIEKKQNKGFFSKIKKIGRSALNSFSNMVDRKKQKLEKTFDRYKEGNGYALCFGASALLATVCASYIFKDNIIESCRDAFRYSLNIDYSNLTNNLRRIGLLDANLNMDINYHSLSECLHKIGSKAFEVFRGYM